MVSTMVEGSCRAQGGSERRRVGCCWPCGWLAWLWEWCFLRPIAGPPKEEGVDWTAQHGAGDEGFIDRHGALFEDNKGAHFS